MPADLSLWERGEEEHVHESLPVDRPAVTPPAVLETHIGPYLFTFHPRSSGVIVSRCVYLHDEPRATDGRAREIHGHIPYDACGEAFDPSAIVTRTRLEGWGTWWLMRRGEWDRDTTTVRVNG